MAAIFSQILNMSMTGSVVILLVMLARLILKRSPKIFSYALWSVVLFRLLCPVAFTAPISVLDVVEPEQKETSNNTSIVTYIPATVNTQADFIMVQPEEQQVQVESVTESEEQLQMTPMHAVALVWAVGMAGMMLYSVIQYLALRRKLVGSVQLKGNIYLADHIDTAFVVGLVQPSIYLPSGVPQTERYFILAHEQHHIRRGDHIIKLLAYLALCIHWFNPLVWIAFVLSGKDMEMSCDEAVIKRLGPDIRADYSASLLRLATHKKILSGMPLAFGEGDTKGRVLNMAKWKKPAKWLVVVCVVLCLIVVCICAFNPEKEIPIEELTRQTSEGPVDTAIGDLCFTYPGGLTSEQRDVDNWNEEDSTRNRRNLPTRRPHNHFFIDDGVDFGGVVDFIVPDDREINLEELNLPTEWVGLDYIAGSSSYPYAEMEYTLIKDGKDYIQMYLYTYSGRGYFLWFYTEQGNPVHKESILKSVELGSFSTTATKLKRDEIVSLGRFNVTIPKGYGYYRNEAKILEITKKDFYGNQNVIACVTARPNSNLPMDNEADLIRWIESVGINISGAGISSEIDDKAVYGDVSLTIHNLSGIPPMDEEHYLYIAGDIVYDLWLDPSDIDLSTKITILESIWINKSMLIPNVELQQPTSTVVTSAAKIPASDLELAELPEGLSRIFNETGGIFFVRNNTIVGGVDAYPLPKEIYDPNDQYFSWLEKSGISDFGDSSLCYMGGMTFTGTGSWGAQFASDVRDGVEPEVERYHSFNVSGDVVYDIWYDMKQLTHEQWFDLQAAVILPEGNSYMATEPSSNEDIAFEKTLAVMDAVSEGSGHIVSNQKNDGNEGPSGYEKTFLFHEGNFLFTNRVLTEGENITETGAYYNRYALLIAEDEWYTNEGHQGVSGDIVWGTDGEPADPESPWLGNRVWNRSFVTYMDTITDEDETCYMFRYDKPYADDPSYDPHYFVNFYFDHSGNFIKVDIQVNLFKDNGFTVTESIVSLDPYIVATEIDQEYFLASGKHLFVPAPSLNSSDTALQRCKSELAHIQSCSQALVCKRDDGRDNGIIEYWKHENDWMTIQRHSGDNMIAYLCKDGSYYDNGEMHGDKIGARDDDGNVLWKAGTKPQSFHIPWLSRYQWNDKNVHYLGTEQANGEISIHLRISEPFPGFEWGNPDYSVTMVFDESHLFLRAELYVNQGHVSESGFTEVETVSSLWSKDVAERIDLEYQRAIR